VSECCALDHRDDELSLRRALLNCHVENVASQKVAERCGFTLIARSGDELRFGRDL